MDSGQLIRLRMTPYSVGAGGSLSMDDASSFTVQINPADFTHHSGVVYGDQKAQGDAATDPKFSAVRNEDVSFSIVLDGTGVVPASGPPEDVKTQLSRLNRVIYQYVASKREPPHVRLLWGTLIFYGRLTSCKVHYTLFKPSGEPLRARVELAFVGTTSRQEAMAMAGSQPGAAQASTTVREGDTLPLLCHQHYGEAGHEKAVARHNGLSGLGPLEPGTELQLPPAAAAAA